MPWSPERSSASGPIDYTEELPWNNGSNCTGSFTEGARRLKDYLKSRFPQINAIYGYSCRKNTANENATSVHGLGRALDLMIAKLPDGSADPRGNEIAQWLIDNASDLGLQLIIWDKSIWSVKRNPRGRLAPYTGPNSHRDHLHIELNAAGAAASTPWFRNQQAPVPAPASTPSPASPPSLTAPTQSQLPVVVKSPIGGVVTAAIITAGATIALYFGWRWFQDQD